MSFQLFPFLLLLACAPKASKITDPKRPNTLLIVADDLGYADLRSFGGNIDKPNPGEVKRWILLPGGIPYRSRK